MEAARQGLLLQRQFHTISIAKDAQERRDRDMTMKKPTPTGSHIPAQGNALGWRYRRRSG